MANNPGMPVMTEHNQVTLDDVEMEEDVLPKSKESSKNKVVELVAMAVVSLRMAPPVKEILIYEATGETVEFEFKEPEKESNEKLATD